MGAVIGVRDLPHRCLGAHLPHTNRVLELLYYPPGWRVRKQVQAALLIWARSDSGWRARVCYLHHTWHTRALVTTWGHQRYAYARSQTGRYDEVHRIRLHGDPSQWPRYRRATPAPASGG